MTGEVTNLKANTKKVSFHGGGGGGHPLHPNNIC